jgi:hypothetical protein
MTRVLEAEVTNPDLRIKSVLTDYATDISRRWQAVGLKA